MTDIQDIESRYIYTELLKVFIGNGHRVTIVSPTTSKDKPKYELLRYSNYQMVKIRILSGTNKNLIKKAINIIALEDWYIRAVKKFLNDEKFDLVLYSTPPITLGKAIKYIKTRDNAKTYLMLKDIFPQNAVDLGMMSRIGYKSIIYNYFRNKEKKLYKFSDYIGCMSEANVNYLLSHNPELSPDNVGLCVNSVIPMDENLVNKDMLRSKYGIPLNTTVFFYGGNFGKPQGIDFLTKVLENNLNKNDRYFVLCGDGTDYHIIESLIRNNPKSNIMLIKGLPKEEYDNLLQACDIGMLFLDYRFTIPNFPSRILPYMEYSMPIFACTDSNTDIGIKIEEGNFGWWCPSNNLEICTNLIDKICTDSSISQKGKNARDYLEKHYIAEISYDQIMNNIE
ncbi:Glycosyltransferase involved in cell wall bisynthesis [Proteiniclasticum ruminis]|uniref:Glycosyltransferase involved in cell wall bisynthesis n=2 Tax=Proteiniclasticum ruminis TaxID=398199 RepID=A0A1G8SCM3_9CLOT|nr:glycosyltransferase family 4 protein [Proteiniclasticum ruminis]SDJ26911.1 Glycosyltransferase involved in cell wall bisynthesis [Proteiniclasticum ruminis]